RGCVAPGQVGTNGTSEPRVSSDNCAASTTSGRSADHDGTTRSSERDSSPRSELLIHSELVMAPSMPHSDGPLATTVYRQVISYTCGTNDSLPTRCGVATGGRQDDRNSGPGR